MAAWGHWLHSVVFGDIGTSPLYAFQTVFYAAPHDIAVDDLRLFGALSLIFWTITLIVSVSTSSS